MVQLPITGQIHYNSDTDNWEMYDGLGWQVVIVDEKYKIHAPWTKWFAWKPVKDIHGNRQFGKTVYRRKTNTYVNHDNWAQYEYGTIFDVLKDTQ